jgi:hypothetical protein
MVVEEFVNFDELDEFLNLAEAAADEDENGIDVDEELRNIGYLAMTGDPAGYPEPLKSAVMTMREYIAAHNEASKHHPWAHADDVAEMFEKAIAEAANNVNNKGVLLGAPIVGGNYLIEKLAEYRVRPWACRAKAQQARFRTEKPVGAPNLPLKRDAIEKLQRSPDSLSIVIGRFANSLRRMGWSKRHPTWNPYCAGLAALPRTADLVRCAGLLAIRPRPLPGLNPQTLCWEPPERRPGSAR